MVFKNRYLYPSFDARSPRVLNVCTRTAQLEQSMRASGQDSAPDYLFHSRELNRSVFVKALRRRRERNGTSTANGTKLYMPYNTEDIYEGGKSAFLDDIRIQRILRDHAGINVEDRTAEVIRDLSILRLLDQLPSFDPLLVRDKLQVEGITANTFYFDIPNGKWNAIQNYMWKKVRPIVAFAYPDSEESQLTGVADFVRKFWGTKKPDALAHIVDSLKIHPSEANSICDAWKGIIYYQYEYGRCQEKWMAYRHWLENDAMPFDFVGLERQKLTMELAASVGDKFDAACLEQRIIFASYEAACNVLFMERKCPTLFASFMRDVVKFYRLVGARMSAVKHSVLIWEILTEYGYNRQLRSEQLINLLTMQREVLEEFDDCRVISLRRAQ